MSCDPIDFLVFQESAMHSFPICVDLRIIICIVVVHMPESVCKVLHDMLLPMILYALRFVLMNLLMQLENQIVAKGGVLPLVEC